MIRLEHLALGFGLLLAAPALAQVPYSSTSQAAPYIPLSGGQNVALVFDQDDGHALLPLGFEFNHYGAVYSYVNVSVNGALNFVTACALGCGFDEVCSAASVCTRAPLEPYPYNPPGLPSAQAPNRVVAAFWDDLVFDTSSAPFSGMRYATLGVAPNRRFVVEWSSLRRFVSNGPGTSHASFQIELHETTDHIIIHYGPVAPGTGNWSGFVGLENATGTEAHSPLSCGAVAPGCDFAALTSLVNRRYEIFVPDLPELAATLAPPTGAMPGASFTLPIELANVGRQDVLGSFDVEAYLSTDLSIGTNDVYLGRVRIESGLLVGAPITSSIAATVPANLPIGVYRLGLVLDVTDEVIEGNENNNGILHSQTFLVGAELSMRFASVTPMGPGETHPISIFLLNSGAAQTNVSYAIYLSTDRVLDAQDSLLAAGSRPVDSVPETEILLDVQVPLTPSGRYYLIGEVDEPGVIPEIDETNNRVVSTSFLIGPDFRISAEGPANVGADSTDTFQIAVRNDGSSAPPVVWQLYLARSPTRSPSDVLIYQGTADTTGVQGLNLTVSATIPPQALGSYFLVAVVDPSDLVDEVDENNNTSAFAPTVVVEGPDIEASLIRGDSAAFSGQAYAVEVELRNRGRARATNFYYSLHLSTNRLITFNDPLLAEIGPVSLASGEVIQRRWVVEIPSGLARGPYVLGLIADWTTLVAEGDETNNVAVFPPMDGFVSVRDAAPDFAALRVLGPRAVAAGELFPASRVLENRGNAPGLLRYEVHLSRSPSLDLNSRLLTSGSVSLGALEQLSGVDTVRAPSGLEPAQYYLVYVLDPLGEVDELDESNNRRASDGAITLEPGPLQISSGQLPVATQLRPYEVGLGARGGSGRYAWASTGGALPAGLTLDGPSGIIRGVPESLGVFAVRFEVRDGTSVAERDFSLVVAEPTSELILATRSLPPLFLGRSARVPLLALGGVPPLRFSVDPALPTELQLSEEGVLFGTPGARHEELFAFQVRDAAGAVSTRLMPLHVLLVAESLRFDVVPLPDGLLGQTYEAPLVAQSGAPPYTFELVGGALPAGLELAGGVLRGVPTQVEVASFRLLVRDARHDQASAIFVVEIEASGQIGFLTTALPLARVGESYLEADDRAVRVRALSSTGSGTVSFSLAAGALPPGLSLEQTGRILGTPERPGVFSFAARAADETGTTAVRAFGLVVDDDERGAMEDGDGGCGCTTQTHSSSAPLLWLLLLLGLFARRPRPRAWMIMAMVAWPSLASAQHGYVFEDGPAPYQSRVGGTVLSFSDDDDGQTTVSLPFSFWLFDRVHSELTISTNGYVTFEGSGLAYSNDDIPHPRAPNAIVAPFWDDLVVAPGSVSLHVEGRAPARSVVIQYASLRRFRSFGASFSMQLHLHEGLAGRIGVHFGPPFGVTQSEPFSASIGLESADGLAGVVLRGCTPFCGAQDLLDLAERRFEGHGRGASDVLAVSIDPPSRVVVGMPFVVPIAMRSEHQNPLGPFRYRVHLVAPFELQPNRVVYEGTIALGSYERLELSPSIVLTSSVGPGRYRLVLELDPLLELSEVDRSNNVLWSEAELELVPPEPDLVALDVQSVNATLRPGDPVVVLARAQNRGSLSAPAEWMVVLSTNRIISAEDRVLARGNVALEPGQTSTITVSSSIPLGTPGGHYFLGLALDPDEALVEENEQNNRRASDGSLIVNAGGLQIPTTVLPGAFLGRDYFGFLAAVGGDGQYSWSLSSGALPSGLSLLASTGEIRGRAEATGRFEFEVQVASGGTTALRALFIDVAQSSGDLAIVTRNFPVGVVGQVYPDPERGPSQIEVTGARGEVSFRLSDSAPAGLELSGAGELRGTPREVGDYGLDVIVRDELSEASRRIPLTVVEPGRLALIARVLPAARLNTSYRAPLEVFGTIAGSTLSFSILGGPTMLPPGIVLTPEGLLVGVPERIGEWNFVAEVYERAPTTTDFDSSLLYLEVHPDDGFAITPSTLPEARVGRAYEVRLSAVGGRAPYAWRLAGEGQLPTGLRLNVDQAGAEESLVLEGTPSSVPATPGGVFAFLLEVTDAQGRRTEQPLSLRVLGADEGLTPEAGGCGCGTTPGTPGWGSLLLCLALWLIRRRA